MVQVAFLSLFLGLTLGPQPVELTVSGPVAAVELLLDGAPVARLDGPPWIRKIDFGATLEPHELVARALDEKGNEVGLARQWLNLPRSPAEVDVLLESGPKGTPVAARLTWRSLTGESPTAIGVTFDGRPLALTESGRVAFPSYDPSVSHVLTTEVRFPRGVIARKDAVFGGEWGSQISMDLTTIPVRLRKGRRLPPPEQLQGWFLAGGQPLSVAAVEQGPAQLLVVADLAALSKLQKLDPTGSPEYRRYHMTLGEGDEVRFIVPLSREFSSPGMKAELFDSSREYTPKDGGLFWLLTQSMPRFEAARQRLADAIAVAGLQALYGSRRRAVLLVLGDQPADASQSGPTLTRRYLESIRVPLYVWSLGGSETAAAWGEVADISSLNRLRKAFSNLEDELKAQHMILVEGRHLPQSITLSPAAAEVLELVQGR
ncbi:MAG TPA: hypothetical protein VF756_01460 [Thermoanaerobaculia bacterium]